MTARSLIRAEAAQEQAEARSLRERTFSDILLSSLPGIFYLFDHTGRIRRWNKNLDQAGQQLTALLLGLKALEKEVPPTTTAKQSVGYLHQLADELMQDLNRLALELRPAALDDWGLPIALKRLLDDWSKRTGLPVEFDCLGREDQRLSAELETTIYRVVQEAMTNVSKSTSNQTCTWSGKRTTAGRRAGRRKNSSPTCC